MKFWLIQRGNLERKVDYSKIETLYNRSDKCVVQLDYMGSAEFEFGAVTHSYIRMWNVLDQYDFFDSGLKTSNKIPLIVFCNKNQKDEIIESIKSFITNPYQLKETSRLDVTMKEKPGVKTYGGYANFWWDIRNNWIAFLGLKQDIKNIKRAIQLDYDNLWKPKTEKERAKMLYDASRW